MSKLRAGVYGCGPDGLWSAAQIRLQNECDLAAAADPDGQARALFRAETGVALLCESFDELLATGIDFVILAGPRRDRPAQVEAATGQGVHCLLHAPMARSGTETDAMLAASEAAGLKLGVLVRGQEDPVFEQMRLMIAADWLGGVVHVSCLAGENGLLNNPPTASDPRLRTMIANHPLLQLGSHHVHLASWLTGKSAIAVTAQSTKGFLPLPADSAVATVVLRGGVLCTFAASHLLSANQFAIHGTDGFVRIADDRITVRGRSEFRGDVFDYLTPGAELAITRGDIAAAQKRAAAARELHGRFARWIDDRDDFPCPGEQAAVDLGILDAIAQAMTSGRTEPVVQPA